MWDAVLELRDDRRDGEMRLGHGGFARSGWRKECESDTEHEIVPWSVGGVRRADGAGAAGGRRLGVPDDVDG